MSNLPSVTDGVDLAPWPARPVFREMDLELGEPLPQVAALMAATSTITEQFRVLRSRVERLGRERPLRCVGLVSAAAGEGKTTVSIGLAHALALVPERRVLLIEADIRRPALGRSLGFEPLPGLLEYLRGEGDDVGVRRLNGASLFVLPAGTDPSAESELLGSERMGVLLEAARQLFDYVVVDCPPLIPVADSVALQDRLDGLLLVVRSRQCPRETVVRAVSLLDPERLRGLIFNAQRDLVPMYREFASRRYGYAP